MPSETKKHRKRRVRAKENPPHESLKRRREKANSSYISVDQEIKYIEQNMHCVKSFANVAIAESLQCTGNQMLETGVKPIKPWYRVFGAASVRENKENTGSQISKVKKALAGVMRSLQRSREDTGNEIIQDCFMAGCLCVKGGNCKVVGLLIFS